MRRRPASLALAFGVLASTLFGMTLSAHDANADGPGEVFTLAVKEADAVELANIRRMVLALDPDAQRCSATFWCGKLELARILRQLVYDRLVIGTDLPEFEGDLDDYVFTLIGTRERDGICGQAAIVYLSILRAFHIDARFVALFGPQATLASGSYEASHATVEVSDGHGRWYWEDPTYNFSVAPSAERSSGASGVLRVAHDPTTRIKDGVLLPYAVKYPTKAGASPDLPYGVRQAFEQSGEEFSNYFRTIQFGPSSSTAGRFVGAPASVGPEYSTTYPYCLMATPEQNLGWPIACSN